MVDQEDMSTTTVLWRSYDGDAKWLDFTMPKMMERGNGYSDYVVVGIDNQCTEVKKICAKNGVRFVPDNEAAGIPNGYINQQYTKLRADEFCDTDYVFYMDSDVECLEEHSVDVLFRNEKPLLLYTRWEDVGDASCWKAPTEKALRLEPQYEFMRRIPLLYPTSVVRDCRQFMELLHLKTLMQYMNGETSISEFNILGAYAWNYRRDLFTWTNTVYNDFEPLPFKQFWSWGNMKQQLEEYHA